VEGGGGTRGIRTGNKKKERGIRKGIRKGEGNKKGNKTRRGGIRKGRHTSDGFEPEARGALQNLSMLLRFLSMESEKGKRKRGSHQLSVGAHEADRNGFHPQSTLMKKESAQHN
jgi:hypothetical protein